MSVHKLRQDGMLYKNTSFPKAVFVLVSLIETGVPLNSSQERPVRKESTRLSCRSGPVSVVESSEASLSQNQTLALALSCSSAVGKQINHWFK